MALPIRHSMGKRLSEGVEEIDTQNASVGVEVSTHGTRAEGSARRASDSEEGLGHSIPKSVVEVEPGIGKTKTIPTQFNGVVDKDSTHEAAIITMSAQAKTRTGTGPETETQASERRDRVYDDLGYFVSPRETNNKDENDKTEQFLKRALLALLCLVH
ncbi:hypothetical protein GLAREA_00063 [Glarea lozoyensis ATCC 20868]|uniref:Uncharacterized protein n=1 Tax=Glarea lozoyensis (strain ATCC 20868 / MF5171) TaxID=1116229 RepID=S3CTC9_GLAL2|nr:uncharacterized protein GLAREA_00063 [Glarea lozoyensis ATCC 20868]EPE28905.1 hypothetical protein GLAREA_00063 [Glarea lozoyensis ATCC 20868]